MRNRRYRRKQPVIGGFLVGMAVLAIAFIVVGFNVITHVKHTTVATICSKEAVATYSKTGGGHQYRVYTADKGTFKISDSHWPMTWRTDSSEAFGRLHTPGVYRITYIGFRFSLFSWFPNILSYERLPDDKAKLANC